MTPLHRHVARLFNPRSRRYHWHQVLGILEALRQNRTPAAEAAFRRLARFRGRLRVDPSHGLPHAMSPEELVRFVAAQQLARWDRRRHRAVIREVSRRAETDVVRRVTRILSQ